MILRPLVIPPLPEPAPTETPLAPQTHTKPPANPGRSGARCRYWPWAELMRLTLGLPVDTCPHCGSRMKLRALVRDRENIERFLRHQGLWTEPLGLAEARLPPYFRTITRLKPTRQAKLFGQQRARAQVAPVHRRLSGEDVSRGQDPRCPGRASCRRVVAGRVGGEFVIWFQSKT